MSIESEEREGSEEDRPYAGEMLGGASADICAGFEPEPLRFAYYEPSMRSLIVFAVVLALLTSGAFAAGSALRVPGGGWWPGWLALPFYLIGVLLGLILLLLVTLLAMGYRAAARYFKNALLTPGVVVSSEPLTVAILAPLGNGRGPNYQGLQRLDLKRLPYHDHTPGTRIPVVSAFHPAEGLDRWLCFEPQPICWGTGRRELIDRCIERMGTEDFDRLDVLVARGVVPANDDELILLNEHDQKLTTFSIREEKKKYTPQPT